jgi:hydrogenase maturation protein HypF
MHGALMERGVAMRDAPFIYDPQAIGAEFRVRGLVQGVGFRPNVWRLATRVGLAGEVLNDGEGVLIRAWGTPEQLAVFEETLAREPPPLARVEAIERRSLSGYAATPVFRIVVSEAAHIKTGIVPDAATCPECLAEVLNPSNRRFRYPFTNCTHCGPRLSIVRAIPYDRASTSMAVFPMCVDCRAEYENPADRRFHAQPNACPVCGPRLWLEGEDGKDIALGSGEDAVAAAARLIASGYIVAIKGIGGFHLACDAGNAAAVSRLRARKQRYHKPFALMARDVAMVRRYARISEAEATLLQSVAAPIVVTETEGAREFLAPAVASGQSSLGFMLPYTPLHHLLMRDLSRPIVLTSGNRSDEPQCVDNAEARRRLAGIVDVWLMHDRDILNRLDDSVARVVHGAPTLLRRARGYAPAPIRAPEGFADAPPILALGAELKSTFSMLSGGQATLSQHIGDLEDATTHGDYRAALHLYRNLFGFTPHFIAVDKHPDYLSTQWGHALARETGARLISVQHHHAHVAAVLAEHGVPLAAAPVLGIVLDGLGLGEDGELWGGEFLLADYRGFKRLARFAPVAMIGGAKAVRGPWRNAFAHLDQFIGWETVGARYPELDIVRVLNGKPIAALRRMVAGGINAPRASSAGRLFDAAAAMVGISTEATSYEGQAACELEALAARCIAREHDGYPTEVAPGPPATLQWAPLWEALLDDLARGVDRPVVAARFHRGVIAGLLAIARALIADHGVSTVVLTGGVFQNRLLLEGVYGGLSESGVDVLIPRAVPANDGGIALGQAFIAAAQADEDR